MKFVSTRNSDVKVTASKAILSGISSDGGLFVPESFPELSTDDISNLSKMSYKEKADFIIGKYFTDFSEQEIKECTEAAYGDNFENGDPAPLVKLGDLGYVLELWHGPTSAFKDVALQILPHFIVKSSKKCKNNEVTLILTATSGDTGKAALEGFKNVKGTEIVVFYPYNGVSKIQKLQMETQEGDNLAVCGVNGNFDDTQTCVKKIFTDKNINQKVKVFGRKFSSANSINLGRLVPQIVYYVSAYTSMLAEGEIEPSEKINFVVPTGNFGNILAAYYARKMGIPVNRLICGSNSNNILYDFIKTGKYDTDREFHLTDSPSMDILVSSNLERLLYDLSGKDSVLVSSLMNDLFTKGKYKVSDEMRSVINSIFDAQWCSDAEGGKEIKKLFDEYSYLCDTHTAVAVGAYDKYRAETGDDTKTVIVSTASPFKFPKAVYRAITGETVDDDFDAATKLSDISGRKMPMQLAELCNKKVGFDSFVETDEMPDYVVSFAGGEE